MADVRDFPLRVRRRRDGRLSLVAATLDGVPEWPPSHEFSFDWLERHSGPQPAADGETPTVVERGVVDGDRTITVTLDNARAVYRVVDVSPVDGTVSTGVWGVLVDGKVD